MENRSLRLPEVIATKLRQFERRRKSVSILRGAAESLALFCGAVLLLALVESLVKPPLPLRLWLSGSAYFLAMAWLLYRVGRPLVQSASLRQSAQAFEAAAKGQFQERILSAVEMAEPGPASPAPGVSSWMMGRTISLAAEEISAVNPAGLVEQTSAKNAWKIAAPLAAVLALACLMPGLGPRTRLALNPYAPTAPLLKTVLTVLPGNCRLKQGTVLEIKASANEPLDEAKVLVTWNDGFRETVPMARNGSNGFGLTLPAVSQGLRYRVAAADAESPLFTAQVDVPPRLGRLQLTIQPPPYALGTNRLVEGGSADFLLGSRVRLALETAGEKIAQAEFLAEGLPPRKLKPEKDGLLLDLQPTNSLTYQLRLTGVNGLPSEPAQKWVLRPVPDEPPAARLVAVGADSGMVQPDEVLPLLTQASDDVGLKRVDLVVLSKDAEVDIKPLYAARTAPGSTNLIASEREVKTSLNYNLADLNVFNGDEVQLQLVATDLRQQTTRSPAVSLSIGSTNKTLEAQAAARLRQWLADLEGQLEDLKQTRASWLSLSRNYKADEPDAQRPAFTLLQSRLQQFRREIEQLGGRLVADSETNRLAEARLFYRLGTTLSTWGGQQRDLLLENARRLDSVHGTNAVEVFDQGRELFSRAISDLEEYRRVAAVLQGALETEVLATRCESAQGRYKRGLPILRGETAIGALGASGQGLLATFFEDIHLNGKVLEQKIANPRFDNYAPANRREQWSARYEGDVLLSTNGDWTLACVADDGVRLTLDGQSLLPAEAWGNHAATQFKAQLKLQAGWHPVVIEFFQGSSESKLQFLAAQKDQPLQEVPLAWLRPPAARPPKAAPPSDPALKAIVQDALKDRVKSSLSTPATAPPLLVPMAGLLHNENLARSVREKLPVAEALGSNLASFAAWKLEDSQKAEAQADELTGLSREAQRVLHEELEKFRWQYEGAAALKPIQNALHELRELNQELRQQTRRAGRKRSEPEQAKLALAQAWEKQLERAAAQASRQFFDTARQKEATLTERATALNASSKSETELQPAVEKLAKTLQQDLSQEQMANQLDQRLNELNQRYRELNQMQERIEREQVSAEARQALPAARAFARAQEAQNDSGLPRKYQQMKQAVARVQKAQHVAGDYREPEKLDALAAQTPAQAQGKELAATLQHLAAHTENNLPSLAQTIPPPLRQQAEALEQHTSPPQDSAKALARPRLALALEASRLLQHNEPKTAVAFELLGQDLGQVLESPAKLNAPALKPLAERAAALAGQKGEEARQAEIKAANERLAQLARNAPAGPQALAAQLDQLSAASMQAAGNNAKRQPLANQLGQLASLAPPLADWSQSSNPKEIAASAAQESLSGMQAAPRKWEAYHQASQTLAGAARQIRLDSALGQVPDPNPAPGTEPATAPAPATDAPSAAATAHTQPGMNGPVGKAISQPAPKGIDQAEWARLNERLRQAIRSSGIEHFSEEQQGAIRAYFERLSSER